MGCRRWRRNRFDRRDGEAGDSGDDQAAQRRQTAGGKAAGDREDDALSQAEGVWDYGEYRRVARLPAIRRCGSGADSSIGGFDTSGRTLASYDWEESTDMQCKHLGEIRD